MLPSGKKRYWKLILNAQVSSFSRPKSNIELIIRDTQGHPEIAINAFKDIIDNNAAFIIDLCFQKRFAMNMTDANVINVFVLTNNQTLKKRVWVFGIDPQKQVEKL